MKFEKKIKIDGLWTTRGKKKKMYYKEKKYSHISIKRDLHKQIKISY